MGRSHNRRVHRCRSGLFSLLDGMDGVALKLAMHQLCWKALWKTSARRAALFSKKIWLRGRCAWRTDAEGGEERRHASVEEIINIAEKRIEKKKPGLMAAKENSLANMKKAQSEENEGHQRERPESPTGWKPLAKRAAHLREEERKYRNRSLKYYLK